MSGSSAQRAVARRARRIVVKVGSGVLTRDGSLRRGIFDQVARQIAALCAEGREVVLVTSGAIAIGSRTLGWPHPGRSIPEKQAAAAVGQIGLVELYRKRFAKYGRRVAQVLLTRSGLQDRERFLNARHTLQTLLELGVVPIVNENDTVVVDELKLGDNDRLAAIVAHLVDAGMLVILTDTEGLYSGDPRISDDAALLSAVRHTDEILDELRRTGSAGALGSGGVATKVSAARMAAWSGVPTVIASASEAGVARRAVRGDDVGTWVTPREAKLGSRKLWIAFGMPSHGTLSVDDGAANALTDRGKSLLAVGVVGVTGHFEAGDAVEVRNASGNLIGKGIAGLSSDELLTSMGLHSADVGGEAIHRDDLVVLVADA